MYLHFQKNKAKIFKVIILLTLFVFLPKVATAASLSIGPADGTYETGETITLRVLVSSDVSTNAVSGSILVPTEFFSIQSVSKNNSVLNFWVTQPSFSNNSGVVRFEGVALSGFQGSGGAVLTVSLIALKSGISQVVFQNGQILANDGQGTDITNGLFSSSIKVIPAVRVPVTKVKPAPVIVPEDIQPAPTLKAPEIMVGTKYGVKTIFTTSDYPKAQALATFVGRDGSKIFITGVTDLEGNFIFPIPSSLKRGEYAVSVVMIKEDKSNSDTSNTVHIEVGSIFSDLSLEVKIIFVVLVLLIIYLILRIYLHLGKNKNLSRVTKHEVNEARKITHKSFDILRSDIHELEGRPLGTGDRKMVSSIEHDIDDAEDTIDKEIGDIESLK